MEQTSCFIQYRQHVVPIRDDNELIPRKNLLHSSVSSLQSLQIISKYAFAALCVLSVATDIARLLNLVSHAVPLLLEVRYFPQEFVLVQRGRIARLLRSLVETIWFSLGLCSNGIVTCSRRLMQICKLLCTLVVCFFKSICLLGYLLSLIHI